MYDSDGTFTEDDQGNWHSVKLSEQEKESLYLEIRQSFALAMWAEIQDMAIVNRVLWTVDDAVQNNLFA
jgi:hypothetical protein